jgi:hypothetical protein
MASELKSIESLLYRLVTAPAGVAEGLAHETALGPGGLAEIVAGDERLTPEQRVDIYANMYFYRILEVLKEDFPATLSLLGADNFHNLVTGYLLEYPPTHFSIGEAGRHLADFLRDHPLRDEFPHCADLARLERALTEVFHARDAVALDAAAMRAIAPGDWPALRMRLHPAAQMLELEWDVASALREFPGAVTAPRRRATIVLVWRNRNRVEYREIDSVESTALKLLADDATFAAVCDALANALDAEDPAAEINARFDLWLRSAILVRA